jgi:CheY-like chemotaxis protein
MSPSNLSGKQVMIVDDDAEIRDALSFIFRRYGCKVFSAASGNEALALLDENAVDVVVTDINMPNGSGVDLLKAIRAKGDPGPMVLLISGFADISNDQAVKLGAEALLQKPIDKKKLLKILEERIRKSTGEKPGSWLDFIGPIFFANKAKSGSELLLEKARSWLQGSSYSEILDHQPLQYISSVYGIKLSVQGPQEAIVQMETEENIYSGSAQSHYEDLFRWKMARPGFRKIVIVVPAAAEGVRLLALYDEAVYC